MCGTGYLSGTVRALSALLSLQRRDTLSFFGTMCRGDAYGLFEGRAVTCCIIESNSTLASLKRSGASRRGLQNSGGPDVVLM